MLVDEGRRAVSAASPVAPRAGRPDTPAFWCIPGTSGKPRRWCMHRFAREVERVSRERLGITADDRLFASSRLFFSHPQTNSLWAGLKLGATVVLDPQWPTAQSVCRHGGRDAADGAVQRALALPPDAARGASLRPRGGRLPVRIGRRGAAAACAMPGARRPGLPMVDGHGASETPGAGAHGLRRGDDGLQAFAGCAAARWTPGRRRRPHAQAMLPRRHAGAWLPRPPGCAGRLASATAPSARPTCSATAGGGWRFAGREDTLPEDQGRWVSLNDLEERLGSGNAGLVEGAAVRVADADGIDALAYFFVAREGEQDAVEQALRERMETLRTTSARAGCTRWRPFPRTATGEEMRVVPRVSATPFAES